MSKEKEFQKKNRQKTAGGVMPSASDTAVSLAITFKKLTKSTLVKKESHCTLLLFIHLWLTGQLDDIDHLDDIPDLKRVSTSNPCEAHCLRSYKDGNTSWVEYAQAYNTKSGVFYLWQPMPTILLPFFQTAISTLSYHTALLNKAEKARFFALLQARWKTPLSLKGHRRNRRNVFFRYFFHCTHLDPALSSLAKMVLTHPDKMHHQNVIAYQVEQSDRLRKKIFLAQNRYLDRIMRAINELNLSDHFIYLVGGQRKNLTETKVPVADYLAKNGFITAFHLVNQNNTKQYEAIPPLFIGCQRSVAEDEVVQFFIRLHNQVEQVNFSKKMTIEQHREYYNGRTYQLAFQFMVLTGVRPTHAITIERRRCFGAEHVCVRDKGKWRQITLCAYLIEQIAQYQSLQKALTVHFPHHQPRQAMWYLINEDGDQQLLNASQLRSTMKALWPGVVPYQLRHFFAQCALTSPPPHHLATQQIDRLMGHANFGEHLGSHDYFPLTTIPLENYLNTLPKRLGLLQLGAIPLDLVDGLTEEVSDE